VIPGSGKTDEPGAATLGPAGAPDRGGLALMGLAALSAAALAIAAVLANKIAVIGGLTISAGAVAYALTFPISDVVCEVWGKRHAAWLVGFGFIALVATYGLIHLALWMTPAPVYRHEAAFRLVVGGTLRIIAASLTAYLVSQFHDVWMFSLWKRVTRGRHLWLRNNVSTLVSQFIDSVVFCTIAFYGIVPLWPLIWGQYVIKLVVALADTPLVYLVVGLLRRVVPGPASQPARARKSE